MAYPTSRSANAELHLGLHEGSLKQVGKDWGGPCLPEPHLDRHETPFSVARPDDDSRSVDSFH